MSNFPKPNYDNLGGNRYFDFIEIENVLSIPLTVNGYVNGDVLLKSGIAFSLGYSTAKTLLFEEKQTESKAGSSFLQKISGFYPGIIPEAIAYFSNMLNKKYIARITDAHGNMRLVGTIDQPLIFSFSNSTEISAPNRPGISYQLICENILPAPFIL